MYEYLYNTYIFNVIDDRDTQIQYEKVHVNILWKTRNSEVQKLQIPQIGVHL